MALALAAASICSHGGDQLHAADGVVYFGVSDNVPANSFVIALSDQAQIDFARKIILGGTERIHVQGKIIKGQVSYNPGRSFYLDPSSITFFKFAPTTCGRRWSTADVEANLDLVGKPGSPLALGYWCPLGSRVSTEITSK